MSTTSANTNPASPPLEFISPTDKGGLIVVLTALTLTWILVSLLIRVYVRWKSAPWKNDDNLLLAATILACIQSALIFLQVNKGLGKTGSLVSAQGLVAIQKAAYASDILYICVLWLSKCSLGLLYRRLTPSRRHGAILWTIIAACTVWAVTSIFLVAIRCHVAHPWTDWFSQCANLFARWQVIGALDIVTEAGLFLMSVVLVKGVRISTKSKAIVVAAFGSRLLVVAPCILRLHYLSQAINSSDETLVINYAVFCTQFEMSYGIMANTIPCLKPFIAPFEGRGPSTSTQPLNDDYKITSVGSGSLTSTVLVGRGSPHIKPSTARTQQSFGMDQPTYTATVSPWDNSTEADNSRSLGSGPMIIETKVGWSVEYDRNSSRDDAPSMSTEAKAHSVEMHV